MVNLLKRVWDAWRRVLDREDVRWRAQLGEPSDATDAKQPCEPTGTPALSDLVAKRQSELKRQ